jgi:hypothetical protein
MRRIASVQLEASTDPVRPQIPTFIPALTVNEIPFSTRGESSLKNNQAYSIFASRWTYLYLSLTLSNTILPCAGHPWVIFDTGNDPPWSSPGNSTISWMRARLTVPFSMTAQFWIAISHASTQYRQTSGHREKEERTLTVKTWESRFVKPVKLDSAIASLCTLVLSHI